MAYDVFHYWFLFLLGFAGLFYLGVPLVIRAQVRMACEPEYEKIELDDPAVPREVSKYFRTVAAQLTPLGFELVDALLMPNPVSRVTMFYLLMVQRANKDYALATVACGRVPAREQGELQEVTRLASSSTECFSRFRDGTQACTSNSPQVPSFLPGASISIRRFPMIADLAKLYRLHQTHVEKHEGTSTKFLRVDEFRGDVGAYLNCVFREQHNEQVSAGYFYLSEEEGAYRPTLKGAYLMTWRQLEPFKTLARKRIEREALRLLKEQAETRP
jgi:hypothetical protein